MSSNTPILFPAAAPQRPSAPLHLSFQAGSTGHTGHKCFPIRTNAAAANFDFQFLICSSRTPPETDSLAKVSPLKPSPLVQSVLCNHAALTVPSHLRLTRRGTDQSGRDRRAPTLPYYLGTDTCQRPHDISSPPRTQTARVEMSSTAYKAPRSATESSPA